MVSHTHNTTIHRIHHIHPSVSLIINPCTVTLNPLDQESEKYLRETHGHSVGFLVLVLVLLLTTTNCSIE